MNNTCVDCGKPINRNARQCIDCYRANRHHPKRKWACIDCGIEIKRKRKRCLDCNEKNLKKRHTYERTPEHKKKMSKATSKPKPWLKGRKRPEVGKNISAAWTDEMKEEARKRGKENAQDKEWLLRVAKSVSGESNPMWKGGIANGSYAPGFSKSLKQKIRTRDNCTCQLCGMAEDELSYRLSIHHSDYDKTNHSENNLFATCKRCNSTVNTNRHLWTAYFVDLAKRRNLL